jgi:DNA-binding transcriptional MerR regulator/protein-tyrosine-phosphatase
MRISTFARRAGISASGVRWYEAAGVLPPARRTQNRYRYYTDADLARLRLVLTLRRLGLTVQDAGRLAERCLTGGQLDASLAATLVTQRQRISERREELAQLEVELHDLEMTIEAAARASDHSREKRTVVEDLTGRPAIGVLFVCNGNSARSQLAEALLGRLGGASFRPLSAGTRPKAVHPLTIRVLAEIGIDWTNARSRAVSELADRRFDYVITLSDRAREECPSLTGTHSSLHWHLADPAAVQGPEEARLAAFRATRADLTLRLGPFIEIARRASGHLPPPSIEPSLEGMR